MNRRSFLKALSAIPFAGSLAVVGPAVASKPEVVRPKPSTKEHPDGTVLDMSDGRIYRYCKAAEKIPKGEFVPVAGFEGVSTGKRGWVQTEGHCLKHPKTGKLYPMTAGLDSY